jgi:hypothetical protein
MSVVFWSGVVEKGKTCEVKIPQGFILHLQRAVVLGTSGGGRGALQVFLKGYNGKYQGSVISHFDADSNHDLGTNHNKSRIIINPRVLFFA